MSQIGSMFVRLGMDLSDFSKGLADAQKQLEGVGEQFSKIGTAMSLAFTAPITAALAFAVKSQAQFESAMNKVAALVDNVTKQELAALDELALKLGKETQFSAKQAADAMGELAASGFTASEIMKSLGGVLSLAAVGQISLAQAAQISSGVLKGFNLDAEKMQYVTDALAKVASKSAVSVQELGFTFKYVGPIAKGVGLAFEEMAAAAGLLGNAFIKGEQAGTSLRGIIARLVDPSKEVRDIFKGLDINVFEASGKMKSLADIMDMLREKGMGAKEIIRLFGQEAGVGMVALMNQGSKALRDWTTDVTKAGGEAKKMADIMRQGLSGAWEELTGTLETLGIQVGKALEPILIPLLKMVTDFGNQLVDLAGKFRELPISVQATAGAFTLLLVTVGPATLILGKAIEMFVSLKGIVPIVNSLGLSFQGLGGGIGGLAAKLGPLGLILASVAATLYKLPSTIETVTNASNDLGQVWSNIFGESTPYIEKNKIALALMASQTVDATALIKVALTDQQRAYIGLGESIKSVWDPEKRSLWKQFIDTIIDSLDVFSKWRDGAKAFSMAVEFFTGKYKLMEEVSKKTLELFNQKYVMPSMKGPGDAAVADFARIQKSASELFKSLAEHGVVLEKGTKSWDEWLKALQKADVALKNKTATDLDAVLAAQRYAKEVQATAARLAEHGIVVDKGSMSWKEYAKALDKAKEYHAELDKEINQTTALIKKLPESLAEFASQYKVNFDSILAAPSIQKDLEAINHQIRDLWKFGSDPEAQKSIDLLEKAKLGLRGMWEEAKKASDINLDKYFINLQKSLEQLDLAKTGKQLVKEFNEAVKRELSDSGFNMWDALMGSSGTEEKTGRALGSLTALTDSVAKLEVKSKEAASAAALLGVAWGTTADQLFGLTQLQSAVANAKKAYETIASSGLASKQQLSEAWLGYAQIVANANYTAAHETGEKYDAMVADIIRKVGTAGQKMTQGLKDSFKEFQESVGHSFEGFFENLFNGKGLKSSLNSLVSDLKDGLLKALEPFKKAAIGILTDLITGKGVSLGGLVTSAKEAASAAKAAITGAQVATDAAKTASTAVQAGANAANTAAAAAGTAADVAGTAAKTASSTADTVSSGAKTMSSTLSSISSVTGIVTGAITAVTGVLSYLADRRMEKDIGRIEVTTRGMLNEALNLRRDLWDQHNGFLARTSDMWATLRDILDAIGSGHISGTETMKPLLEIENNIFTRLGEVWQTLDKILTAVQHSASGGSEGAPDLGPAYDPEAAAQKVVEGIQKSIQLEDWSNTFATLNKTTSATAKRINDELIQSLLDQTEATTDLAHVTSTYSDDVAPVAVDSIAATALATKLVTNAFTDASVKTAAVTAEVKKTSIALPILQYTLQNTAKDTGILTSIMTDLQKPLQDTASAISQTVELIEATTAHYESKLADIGKAMTAQAEGASIAAESMTNTAIDMRDVTTMTGDEFRAIYQNGVNFTTGLYGVATHSKAAWEQVASNVQAGDNLVGNAITSFGANVLVASSELNDAFRSAAAGVSGSVARLKSTLSSLPGEVSSTMWDTPTFDTPGGFSPTTTATPTGGAVYKPGPGSNLFKPGQTEDYGIKPATIPDYLAGGTSAGATTSFPDTWSPENWGKFPGGADPALAAVTKLADQSAIDLKSIAAQAVLAIVPSPPPIQYPISPYPTEDATTPDMSLLGQLGPAQIDTVSKLSTLQDSVNKLTSVGAININVTVNNADAQVIADEIAHILHDQFGV